MTDGAGEQVSEPATQSTAQGFWKKVRSGSDIPGLPMKDVATWKYAETPWFRGGRGGEVVGSNHYSLRENALLRGRNKEAESLV